MKKKNTFITLLLTFCIIIPAMFMFTACQPSHTHTFDNGICAECGAIEGLQFQYIASTKTYKVWYGGEIKVTELVIPSSYNDGKHGEHPVTIIGEGAFSRSNLISVVIPDSVTDIERHAFGESASLNSITFGGNLKTIGTAAFCDCTSLTSLRFPDSLQTIDESAFQDCTGLTSVIFGSGVKSILGWAFRGCTNLTSLTIPNGVTTIGQYTFCACHKLKNITLPNSLTVIGFAAFIECRMTNIYYQGTEAEWANIQKGNFGKVHPDYEDDIYLNSETEIVYNG